jgi:fructokinase
MGLSPAGERIARMSVLGAIEAGGTKFVLAIASPGGAILERTRIDTAHPDTTFPEIAAFFRSASARHGPIAAFGIASFGPIDIDPASASYGTFTTTPKPGWSGARFHDALAGFDVPIAVDTDVNGAALGEWLKGAGKGCGTLAYTTIGTGIGTGIVKGGRSVSGFSHYESGHIRPPRDAARDPFTGTCPFHGDCLEGLASGPAIKSRWGHDLSAATPDQIDLIASYVGDLAATLVLVHMPEKLIFGGGVMKVEGLIDGVRGHTRARLAGYVPAFDTDLSDRIVAPGLGDDAGITGAIELARIACAGGK